MNKSLWDSNLYAFGAICFRPAGNNGQSYGAIWTSFDNDFPYVGKQNIVKGHLFGDEIFEKYCDQSDQESTEEEAMEEVEAAYLKLPSGVRKFLEKLIPISADTLKIIN